MTLHAKMCCYSTVTTPLSILDDSGVIWFIYSWAGNGSVCKTGSSLPTSSCAQMGRLRVLTVCDHFTFRENPLHFRLAVLYLL